MVRDFETPLNPGPARQAPLIFGAAPGRRLEVEDLLQDAADSMGLTANEAGELVLGEAP